MIGAPTLGPEDQLLETLALPQPIGDLAPWKSVLDMLNVYLSSWFRDGQIMLPMDVTALQDSDGRTLLFFMTNESGSRVTTILPPVYPLTVTISDARGRNRYLIFPDSATCIVFLPPADPSL